MFAEVFISVGIAFISKVAATVTCPDGFQAHGSTCYKILALEASWIEAKQYCRLLGTDLAAVPTASEEQVLEGLLTAVHGSHIDETYWLAGSDIIAEKDWRWMTGAGPFKPFGNYTNWASHRPDNSGGNENCLTMVYNHGRTHWDDKNCQDLHSFICSQRSTEPPVSIAATEAVLVG